MHTGGVVGDKGEALDGCPGKDFVMGGLGFR